MTPLKVFRLLAESDTSGLLTRVQVVSGFVLSSRHFDLSSKKDIQQLDKQIFLLKYANEL